jgi:ABC-2 type transport system permease protein
MTARLPFMDLQTDWWQVVLSISLLALSTWASIKFAARIYRTGILIYGQKPSLKTIWKWYKQSK